MAKPETSPPAPLLRVEDLQVSFAGPQRPVSVLRGVSFDIHRGEIFAVVGESGSGKTMTSLAILGLLPEGGHKTAGRLILDGVGDLSSLTERQRRRLRGRRIAMIFQDPMSALNPVWTIGFQIAESLRLHRGLGRRAAKNEALKLLEMVAMPDPKRRLRNYPHELSGGQLQRAMIAVALASSPDLLLADEPTTALDVTLQAQILDLLADLRTRLGLTVLLITHDLGVVAEICDRVAVMYAGQIVEVATVGELFNRPAHPYTQGLLAAVPRLGGEVVEGLPGNVPDPADLPAGCAFHPRCRHAVDRCRSRAPELEPLASDGQRAARCWLQAELLVSGPAASESDR